jgi:hypothetical protein
MGTVTQLNAICNAANAQKAVQTVRQMILAICEMLDMERPKWIAVTDTRADGSVYDTTGWLKPL